MSPPGDHRVELVRGRLEPALGERLVEFWTRYGALSESRARERLAEVVAVRFDSAGEIAGVNSVYAGQAPVVGRRMWIYRRFLAPGSGDDAELALLRAAREELARGFAADRREPEGLCVLVRDRGLAERHPQAVWPEAELLFAGYTGVGEQVRIGYFDAEPAPAQATEQGYRVLRRGDAQEIGEAALLDFWRREGAVSGAAARRRVEEVAFVGLAPGGEIAGVSTVYLAPSEQLRMPMWHYRTFVGREHRRRSLAEELLARAVGELRERYVSGRDTRAGGVIFELEYEGLKRAHPEGVWPRIPFAFIGENARGDHVRVLYFPGASAPPPPPAASAP